MESGNPDPEGIANRPFADGPIAREAAPALFAATIRPHRSLGPDAFRVLMIALGLVMLVPSAVFAFLGFWPVAGFFGLDLLALYIALRVSFRGQAAFEEIELTPVALTLRRVGAGGQARTWRFNPAWTRLTRQEDEEFGLLRLALVSRGRSVALARDLSPPERAHFAEVFGAALARAKRGF